MSHCKNLIDDNIGYLQQASNLLQRMPDDLYSKNTPLAFSSSVGSHLRHCLEHYESLLAGWQTGKIDYDARTRNVRIETDRQYTLTHIAALIAALRRLEEEDENRRVHVKQDSNTAHEVAPTWSVSTVRRELQFLVSHTVHHYALIAMILRLHGCEPGADFGVAPSTLKHRQALKACAQ